VYKRVTSDAFSYPVVVVVLYNNYDRITVVVVVKNDVLLFCDKKTVYSSILPSVNDAAYSYKIDCFYQGF
jgi:hypothetical protein